MATLRREIRTRATPEQGWDAVRDFGALHTRLVPGFVVDTRIDGNARIVTFGNGTVMREPIVAIDDTTRRLVWSAESGRAAHYNASAQVVPAGEGGIMVIWTADFLPDTIAPEIAAAMDAGAAVMRVTLDRLAGQDG